MIFTDATTNTWTAWNTTYYVSSTAATTASTWDAWNVLYVDATGSTATSITTSSTAATTTWDAWNERYERIVASTNRIVRPSREQLQRDLERERRLRIEANEARSRAELLLRQHLTEQQVRQLEERKFFEIPVLSRDGATRRYRIRDGYAGNVDLLGADGKPKRRYCIHPKDRLPNADAMLAQKLMLETNEELFLQIANETVLN